MILAGDCLLWAQYQFVPKSKAGYRGVPTHLFHWFAFGCSCQAAVVSQAYPGALLRRGGAGGGTAAPHKAQHSAHSTQTTSSSLITRAVLLVKQRRKSKLGEAQPAGDDALPGDLPVHLRRGMREREQEFELFQWL